MALILQIDSTAIKPAVDNSMVLGTSALEFKDLYIDGLAYIDGLGEDLLVTSSYQIQFRDNLLFISSKNDGHLDIDADASVDINSNLDVIGTIKGNGYYAQIITVTGDYTILISDDIILVDASSIPSGFSTITITLPPASSVEGKIYYIKALTIESAGSITVDPPSGEQIDDLPNKVITSDYSSYIVASNGVEWYIIG